MDYKKKYDLQVRINGDLRNKISELAIENEKLMKENRWNESVTKSQQENQQNLEKAYKEFKDGLEEIKEKKKKLDDEIKLAQQERAKYKKRMEKFMKHLEKKHKICDG